MASVRNAHAVPLRRALCWCAASALVFALLAPAPDARAQELPDVDLNNSPGLLVESLELSRALPLEHSAGFLLEEPAALRDLQETISIGRSPAGLVEGLTYEYSYSPHRSDTPIRPGIFPVDNLIIAQSRNEKIKRGFWCFICALELLTGGNAVGKPGVFDPPGPPVQRRIEHVAPGSTGGSGRNSSGARGGGGRTTGRGGPGYKLYPE